MILLEDYHAYEKVPHIKVQLWDKVQMLLDKPKFQHLIGKEFVEMVSATLAPKVS